MAYMFNTPEDQRAMLEAIGVESIEQLFEAIPAEIRFQGDLEIPAAMGELELTQHMSALAEKNLPPGQAPCFLGGGSYDHFIPAVVDAISSRGEIFTSYTPYQPEVSQGNLQAMFEYQTLICQLTGMDVSNASLYDGGSAAAEAALMSISVTRRDQKVVVPETVHPEYREILSTYLTNLGTKVETVPCPGGVASIEAIAAAIDSETACVLVQHPNFFGQLEEVEQLAEAAHAQGALLVVAVDPISLGLLRRPGDLGADIVVAEGQSLGSPMSFGGPYLGIMACREKFVRRLPGRIAGQTVDRRGKRCWVLTLQTREQHIRRDKATSNICTNQGLFALRASVYLAALGPHGLRAVSDLSLRKAHYAADKLTGNDRFELKFAAPFFKEFVVRDRQGQVDQLLGDAASAGLLAGISLGRWYPELSDCFLVAVTEQRTRAEIDLWSRTLTNATQLETASHA
ncbi:MAG: aminomethyl-transferring glycine dehydrogenase subunit GcvPA [Pirellulaceae bacterium]|nr:aminomethyl-transferring glycine dehydrogenase subunit GcvPA [Pirellulaceae bacterium]